MDFSDRNKSFLKIKIRHICLFAVSKEKSFIASNFRRLTKAFIFFVEYFRSDNKLFSGFSYVTIVNE